MIGYEDDEYDQEVSYQEEDEMMPVEREFDESKGYLS